MKYWFEKDEELVKRFVSGDTSQKTYDKLKTRATLIIQNIAQRYYAVPAAHQMQYYDECLSFVIEKLWFGFNPRKGTAFNFIGLTAKNWYYDNLVRPETYVTKIKLDYIDTDDDFDNSNNIVYKTSIYDRDKLLKRIAEIRTHIVYKNTIKAPTIAFEKQLKFLDLCVEYIYKYDSFNSSDVYEYVVQNMGIEEKNIPYLFHSCFGIMLNQIGRYRRPNNVYSYINDDITPIDAGNLYRKRKFRKSNNNEYLYF
jgi:hypothetical protein